MSNPNSETTTPMLAPSTIGPWDLWLVAAPKFPQPDAEPHQTQQNEQRPESNSGDGSVAIESLPESTRVLFATVYALATSSEGKPDAEICAGCFAQACERLQLTPDHLTRAKRRAKDAVRNHKLRLSDTELFVPLPHRCLAITSLLSVALSSGKYDSRERIVVRQVARLLCIPWRTVATSETLLMQSLLASASASQGNNERTASSNSAGVQNMITRGLVIGGFTIVGGTALYFTGGLAAPLILPALQAAGSGTAALASAVGLTGAAAGIAVATGVVLETLTVPVLATMLGLGGGGLCAYRATQRTAGITEFRFCKVSDVPYPEEATFAPDGEEDDHNSTTVPDEPVDEKAPKKKRYAVESVNEADHDLIGPVVPLNMRSTTMRNLRASCNNDHRLPITIENRTSSTLRLRFASFRYGTWGFAPPQKIAPQMAGTCLARNRDLSPTGVSGVIVYSLSATCDLVVIFGSPIIGLPIACARVVKPAKSVTEEMVVEYYQHATAKPGFSTVEDDGNATTLVISWSGVQEKVFSLTAVDTVHEVTDKCPCKAHSVEQNTNDARDHLSEYRRYCVTSFLNQTSLVFRTEVCEATFGQLYVPNTHGKVPDVALPGQALVLAAHNRPYFMMGSTIRLQLVSENNIAVTVEVSSPSVGFFSASGKVFGNAEDSGSKDKISAPTSNQEDCVSIFTFEGTNYVLSWKVSTRRGIANFRLKESSIGSGAATSSAMHVTLGVTGFMSIQDARFVPKEQIGAFWYPILKDPSVLGLDLGEGHYLRWETEQQLTLGDYLSRSVATAMKSAIFKKVKSKSMNEVQAVLIQSALVTAYWQALGIVKVPNLIMWGSGIIDNCFTVLNNRAVSGGVELANALKSGAHGQRPVTLIGISAGATLIINCLLALQEAGARGIVENAYVLGCTSVVTEEMWSNAREVVSGRLVNVFSPSDWFIAFLQRTSGVSLRPVAGVARVRNVPGVENVDASHVVVSHGVYLTGLQDVLEAIPAEPTWETLDPHGSSAGACIALPDFTPALASALRKDVPGRFVLCVCVKNESNLELGVHGSTLQNGRWDSRPPEIIGAGVCGFMSAVAAKKTVSGTVTFTTGHFSVVIVVRENGTVSADIFSVAGEEVDDAEETKVQEGCTQFVVDGTTYTTSAADVDEEGIAYVSLKVDDVDFNARLRALVEENANWSPLNEETAGVQSLPSPDSCIGGNESFTGGTGFAPIVPVSFLEEKLRHMDLTDMRFAVIITNSSSQPLTVHDDVIEDAVWKSPLPCYSIDPDHALICPVTPITLTDDGAAGFIVVRGATFDALCGFQQGKNALARMASSMNSTNAGNVSRDNDAASQQHKAVCCLGATDSFLVKASELEGIAALLSPNAMRDRKNDICVSVMPNVATNILTFTFNDAE